MKIKAGEVQPDEANITLALADVDGARGGGGLLPVGEVLAVCTPTLCKEVTADSKATSTGATIFPTL